MSVINFPSIAPAIAWKRHVWPELENTVTIKSDYDKFTTQQLMENFALEDFDLAGSRFQRAVNAYKACGYEAYQNELDAIAIRLSAVCDRITDEISTQRNEDAVVHPDS